LGNSRANFPGDQMADDPIDFEVYRLGKGLSEQIPVLRAEIEEIQAVDVSALKPHELGKLRDRLLRLKLILAVCEPIQSKRLMAIDSCVWPLVSARRTESFSKSFVN
jgi:hypothetical protein